MDYRFRRSVFTGEVHISRRGQLYFLSSFVGI